MKQRVIVDMNKLNPPNERAVLAKGDDYVEFAWNASERGVRVTQGNRPHWHFADEWDRCHTVNMTRPDARQHWIAYKRLGYRRETTDND